MAQEQLPKEIVQRHQRERIAEKACAVFAQKGYRAATIDDIVAAARVSVGSFYGLFEGKEDRFLFLYDSILEDTRRQIAAAIPAGSSWPEAAVVVLRELSELIASSPDRASIVLIEAQTAGRKAERRYEETMAEVVRLLREGRAVRLSPAELPGGLEPATVAGAAWLLHQRLGEGRLQEIRALLPDLIELVLEPYLESGDQLAAMAAPFTNAPG